MARKLTSEDVDELFEASNRQIRDLPDSYVVNDGVSVGRGNKIPLWLFGFLYYRAQKPTTSDYRLTTKHYCFRCWESWSLGESWKQLSENKVVFTSCSSCFPFLHVLHVLHGQSLNDVLTIRCSYYAIMPASKERSKG